MLFVLSEFQQMISDNDYDRGKIFASLPRTTRGLPVVIGQSPKGDKISYANGNSVYIVNLENLTDVDIYTEHSVAATVAKISPSGFYCCSGDNAGNVRIWDLTQSTHILKATYQVFSGPIRDIAWNDDSKRIAAVGEGRERFGHVFLFDTGTSNGNLTGQSRPMSSIDFRPTRPFRLVSGSEDNTVALFEGPPFKFKTTFHEHSRFVHVTKYNPDGSLFASAGADGKVILFEGAEGTKVGELVDEKCKGNAHNGSVFGLTWSPCGKKVATASGDKTVKIWNAEQKLLERTVCLGAALEDQQLSVTWTSKILISVSLAGFLNFIDPQTGEIVKGEIARHTGNIAPCLHGTTFVLYPTGIVVKKNPASTIHGHNKPITSCALSSDRQFLFTSDFEGHITRWDVNTGETKRITPQLHKAQVVGMAVTDNETLLSVAWDDTIHFTKNINENIGKAAPESVKLPSQPWGLAAEGSTVVVACYQNIVVFQNEKMSINLPIDFPATGVALLSSKNIIAVGGQDSKVHIYSISGSSLNEIKTLSHSGPLTSVSFSKDGEILVATDNSRKVVPYAVNKDYSTIAEKEWTFHTAKVNCCSIHPNGRFLATGGLDTNIIVWDLQRSGEHPIIIKGAHAMSPINGLAWIGEKQLISVGQDASVKQWTVKI